jgi:hypothetical protein
MSADNYQVPISAQANAGLFRDVLNTILARLAAGQAGYGSSLPPIADQVDGRLFVVTPGNTQYQARAGVWVAI